MEAEKGKNVVKCEAVFKCFDYVQKRGCTFFFSTTQRGGEEGGDIINLTKGNAFLNAFYCNC